jgi:hypothetical protein
LGCLPLADVHLSKHLSNIVRGEQYHFDFCGIRQLWMQKLALSAPFTDDDIDVLLEHAQQKAEEYGIPIYVEKELLVTRLFSPRVAEGKTVILFAYNQDILDEYMALKEFKRKAVEEGRLEEVEEEIAW